MCFTIQDPIQLYEGWNENGNGVVIKAALTNIFILTMGGMTKLRIHRELSPQSAVSLGFTEHHLAHFIGIMDCNFNVLIQSHGSCSSIKKIKILIIQL